MNKQTAVNWLIKNLMLNGLIRLTQDQHSLYKELTEEAKAMEKEQIMKAYGQGIADEAGEILDATKDAQQYYNETFKPEKWDDLVKKNKMKQETLEEAAIRTFDEFKLKNPIVPESAIYPYKLGFAKGTTWQQERMYSEEDMRKAFKDGSWVTSWSDMGIEMKYDTFEQWFEQHKKK